MSKASSSYARLPCPLALPRGRGERKKAQVRAAATRKKVVVTARRDARSSAAGWPRRAPQARPLLGSGPPRALPRALSLSTPTRTKAVLTLDTFTAFPLRTDGGWRRPRRDHRVREPGESCFFLKSICTILTIGISCEEEIGDGRWASIFKIHPFLSFPKPHVLTLKIGPPPTYNLIKQGSRLLRGSSREGRKAVGSKIPVGHKAITSARYRPPFSPTFIL